MKESVRVNLHKPDRSFNVAPGQSVLDAALQAHLNLPHSCKGGNCGACRARLLAGDVCYPNGRPLGLSDAEAADGFILLCQAHPESDLSIETFEVGTPEEVSIKRLPARIERAEQLSHDVMALFLRLPPAEAFDFQAGQYIDIMLPQGRRRSFSIASPPHDSRLLELHVRRARGGEFTDRSFTAERIAGTLLSIEGPLGHFVYRESAAPHPVPMLLVGGGTGLAPLNSIVRHVLENGLRREITLYWGVRTEHDLYAHAALARMARGSARFRYFPVLSEPSTAWRGLAGLVHDAVLRTIDGPLPHDVYASGPPGMIDAVRREFHARGVPPARLFFDSFDYAPDSRARQLTMAETTS